MSAQLDLISGNDLSALSSVTQEDLMQAINKIAPLSNIGLIVASATRPDITNNPRFIRYGWLDISTPSTPVLKAYTADRTTLVDLDASWSTVSGALSSILTSMFAARSTTGGVTIGLIKTNSGYTDAGNAYYILRVASNGKDVEAVTLDSALSGGGGVALARLSQTGIGAGKFIGYDAGVAGWVSIVPSTDLIGSSRVAVETNIVPGTALYILRTNAAGNACEWVATNAATLFAAGDIALASLVQAATAAHVLRRNDANTASEWGYNENVYRSGATTIGSTDANITGLTDVAHGLGGYPDVVTVKLINKAANVAHGYSVGDVITLDGVNLATNATPFNVHFSSSALFTLSVTYDANNVNLHTKDGSALIASSPANFTADWNVSITLIRFRH